MLCLNKAQPVTQRQESRVVGKGNSTRGNSLPLSVSGRKSKSSNAFADVTESSGRCSTKKLKVTAIAI